MADRKKQHYVPQFYLRRFSLHSAGSALGLYNIPTEKVIPSAKLRTQAYRNYFYGENLEAEEQLSVIEGRAASVVASILRAGKLPTRLSKEHQIVLTFTIFQKNRTVYAAKQQDELIDKVIKTAYAQHPLVRGNAEKFHVHYNNP